MNVSTADVAAVTGITPASTTVEYAKTVIESVTNTDLSVTAAAYSTAAERWLKRAVCYQAAWMHTQPDLFSRTDVASLQQDGVSFQTRDDMSMVLAPLARIALQRVRWVGTHTKKALPSDDSTLPLRAQTLQYDGRDRDWRPL